LILALDTSTAACTAALFAADGTLLASADEVIGRGHAERLVPMVAEMLGAHRPERVLVGCGPGSFTGLRVGIAAAHGMAIGWNAELAGFSSLALLAAGSLGTEPVVAAVPGGHGELFLQEFGGGARPALGPLLNLPPDQAAAAVTARRAIGPAAGALVEACGWGEAIEALPTASHLLRLPAELRSLSPRPIYPRAPDARPKAA
jgi:tRNA threonylcarbamoyl adenosine modification protein YeaZ